MSELAVIELGSNVDPELHVPQAVRELKALGTIKALSKVYETEPFGPPGQPPFINAALALETDLEPLELRGALRQIEADLGRKRSGDRYSPRVIDLDICLYGQRQIADGKLEIPDPDIIERPYLAKTIAEVAPDFIHPGKKLAMREIAERMDTEQGLKERPELTQAAHERWKLE